MSLGDIGAGARLGPYELLLPIARGGMAMVFAARLCDMPGNDMLVAIKTMLPALADDPEFEEMFKIEADLAAQIRHPSVAEILDVGEQDEVLYIAMEWVEGEAVSTILKAAGKAALPPGIAARIGIDAAAGLHAAHELRRDGVIVGLVHRDVSPQNILVTYEGTVKIVDFGVAKATIRAQQAVTRVGTIKGKVPFMAPEQAAGKPVDRRIDVFALGICLYQMVTGKHPFRAETDVETLSRILDATPATPPIELNPRCSPHLSAAIAKALAKNRDARFATMLEVSEALEAAVAAMKPEERAGKAEVASYLKGLLGQRAAKRQAAIARAIQASDERISERPHGARMPSASPPVEPPGSASAVKPSRPEPSPAAPEPRIAAPVPARVPRPVRADLGEILREADEPLTVGLRLRIALDLIESLEPVPLAKRTPASRMRVERVRIDAEGVPSVEGPGDGTGTALLAWEIVAGRASPEDPPQSLDAATDDVPATVQDALAEALAAGGSMATSAFHQRLDDASRGHADATDDVRRAISPWLREALESAGAEPASPAAPLPPAAAKTPAAKTPIASPGARPAATSAPVPPGSPAGEKKAPSPLPSIEVAKTPAPPQKPQPPPTAPTPSSNAAAELGPPARAATPPAKPRAPALQAAAVVEAPAAKAESIAAKPTPAREIAEAPALQAAATVEAAVAKAEPIRAAEAPAWESAEAVEPDGQREFPGTLVGLAPATLAKAFAAVEAAAAMPEPAALGSKPSAFAGEPVVPVERRAPPTPPAAIRTPRSTAQSTPAIPRAQSSPALPSAKRAPPPAPPTAPQRGEKRGDDTTDARASQPLVAAGARSPGGAVPSPPAAPAPIAEEPESTEALEIVEEPEPKKAAAAPAKREAAAPAAPAALLNVQPPPVPLSAARPAARRSNRPPPAALPTPLASAVDDDPILVAQRRAARNRWLVVGCVIGALALTGILGQIVSGAGEPAASSVDGGADPTSTIARSAHEVPTSAAVSPSVVPTAPTASPAAPTTASPATVPIASAPASSRGLQGAPAASSPRKRPAAPKPFLPDHL